MIIVPIHNEKKYEIWRLIAPYLLFPLNHTIEPENGFNYEAGFRLTTIIAALTFLESFTRTVLYEQGEISINEIVARPEWHKKYSCIDRLKRFFKNRERKSKEDIEWYNHVNKKFLEDIEEGYWIDLLEISKQLGKPIESSISQASWEFLTHLKNLRNGLVHGVGIEFKKSNFPDKVGNSVTSKYLKALKYFDKGRRENKIINLEELLETQDIDLVLNKKVTDAVIERTIKAVDEIANLFPETNAAKDWQEVRNMA